MVLSILWRKQEQGELVMISRIFSGKAMPVVSGTSPVLGQLWQSIRPFSQNSSGTGQSALERAEAVFLRTMPQSDVPVKKTHNPFKYALNIARSNYGYFGNRALLDIMDLKEISVEDALNIANSSDFEDLRDRALGKIAGREDISVEKALEIANSISTDDTCFKEFALIDIISRKDVSFEQAIEIAKAQVDPSNKISLIKKIMHREDVVSGKVPAQQALRAVAEVLE